MKIPVTILCVLCASAFIWAGCQQRAEPDPASTASQTFQKWEYKTVEAENYSHHTEHEGVLEAATNAEEGTKDMHYSESEPGDFYFDGEADLAKLGDQGWELVAAIPQAETVGDAEDYDQRLFANVRTGKIILIFKRPEK